jgi:hypothetical protein
MFYPRLLHWIPDCSAGGSAARASRLPGTQTQRDVDGVVVPLLPLIGEPAGRPAGTPVVEPTQAAVAKAIGRARLGW